jgi:ATP-dependent Lon protease
VLSQFEQYVKLNKKVPPEVLVSVNQIDEPAKLADTIASHLSIKLEEKQELLEVASLMDRMERVCGLMEGEIGVLQVEKKNSQPREASDGENAARILSQRANEGDSEGARRRRRWP